MNLFFFIGHPAQYYLFKNTYNYFKQKGYRLTYIIRDKDILEKLLIEEQEKYYKINYKGTGKGKFAIFSRGFIDLIKQDFKLLTLCLKDRPTLMIGTNYSITHIGYILRIPSIVLNEDDFKINKFFCWLTYPFAKHIISPKVCDVGKYNYKKIEYDGYQKLAYLHPKYFTPNIEVLKQYFRAGTKYVLIRLVNFNAGHDIESVNSGIQKSLLRNIITLIEELGYEVYISNEGKVDEEFRDYELKIKFSDIHNIMYYSSLFIADSQSMIVEAAVLGVPSIRYNSFVGKISVLNELEKKYMLTNGVRLNNQQELMGKINQILKDNNYKQNVVTRKNKMLLEKIDLTGFLIWFIENYPSSAALIKVYPDHQKKFINNEFKII